MYAKGGSGKPAEGDTDLKLALGIIAAHKLALKAAGGKKSPPAKRRRVEKAAEAAASGAGYVERCKPLQCQEADEDAFEHFHYKQNVKRQRNYRTQKHVTQHAQVTNTLA